MIWLVLMCIKNVKEVMKMHEMIDMMDNCRDTFDVGSNAQVMNILDS